ncbi:uncharacterized protein LOC119472958 [Cebus imitator]|uniref:uncharacterized protein LOC119472958 n=1 Tax=Cebus imitator TaxID=2715852 RepID=UPI001898449E|nr:uncharacterized protein LOC119472958 [Cebus imitator]
MHTCTYTHVHIHAQAHIYAYKYIETCAHTDFSAGQGGQLGFPGWAGGEGRGRAPSPVTEPAREAATSGGRSHICLWVPMLASNFPGLPVAEKPRGNLCGWGMTARTPEAKRIWQPKDPPYHQGNRISGSCPSLSQHSGAMRATFSGLAHSGPAEVQQPFLHMSRKLLASSLPLPLRSSAEGSQAGVSSARGHSAGPGALGLSGDGRQAGQKVLSAQLPPLLSLRLACPISHSLWLQEGRPLVTGQLLPPAPGCPDHSCLTWSHQNPPWPEPSLHGQPAGLEAGRAWARTEAPLSSLFGPHHLSVHTGREGHWEAQGGGLLLATLALKLLCLYIQTDSDPPD